MSNEMALTSPMQVSEDLIRRFDRSGPRYTLHRGTNTTTAAAQPSALFVVCASAFLCFTLLFLCL